MEIASDKFPMQMAIRVCLDNPTCALAACAETDAENPCGSVQPKVVQDTLGLLPECRRTRCVIIRTQGPIEGQKRWSYCQRVQALALVHAGGVLHV
jgi:hypothetical protein